MLALYIASSAMPEQLLSAVFEVAERRRCWIGLLSVQARSAGLAGRLGHVCVPRTPWSSRQHHRSSP